MLSKMIEERLGQKVRVYYLSDNTTTNDRGVVVEQDGVFIRLERSAGTDLLIPISAIRIIVTDERLVSDNRTLPRAVGALPEESPPPTLTERAE